MISSFSELPSGGLIIVFGIFTRYLGDQRVAVFVVKRDYNPLLPHGNVTCVSLLYDKVGGNIELEQPIKDGSPSRRRSRGS
jgi:hypothetical protein